MRLLLLTILFLLACTSANAGDCTFTKWTNFKGSSILRIDSIPAYVFSPSQAKVDADGAPNAYHPADIGLHCTKGTGFKGLDCPANAGYPNSDWWQSVLVPDPKNPKFAFVQPQNVEFAGFFVTQTTLSDSTKPATDPKKYVDSRHIPYIVFPGPFRKMKGTGDMGDFGFAINITNGKASEFIVAEAGPSDAKLGEISIGLATALGGTNPNPRTGSGAPNGKIIYVVFPNSRQKPVWPVSSEQIVARSRELLMRIGGQSVLTDCRDAL